MEAATAELNWRTFSNDQECDDVRVIAECAAASSIMDRKESISYPTTPKEGQLPKERQLFS
jgi:hypothetical protein